MDGSKERVRRERLIAELQTQRAICDAAAAALVVCRAVISSQREAEKSALQRQRSCRARIKAARAQLRAEQRAGRK